MSVREQCAYFDIKKNRGTRNNFTKNSSKREQVQDSCVSHATIIISPDATKLLQFSERIHKQNPGNKTMPNGHFEGGRTRGASRERDVEFFIPEQGEESWVIIRIAINVMKGVGCCSPQMIGD